MSRNLTAILLSVGLMLTHLGCAGSEPVQEDQLNNAPPLAEKTGTPPVPAGRGPIDDDAPEDFTVTDSGLKYRILRKSDGKKPGPTDTVRVNYQGWLDSGAEFDSSYKRGQPFDFAVNGQVIEGWKEGIRLFGVGGMIELEIPGDLAYPDGRFGIPPGATLHFTVELEEILRL